MLYYIYIYKLYFYISPPCTHAFVPNHNFLGHPCTHAFLLNLSFRTQLQDGTGCWNLRNASALNPKPCTIRVGTI